MLTRGTGIGVALVLLCALAVSSASAASHWVPQQQLTWYWQLTGTPKVEPVQAIDVDGFDNSAATVAAFRARGQRAICYTDVGTSEDWRPDASQFPSSVLGASNGWPGERWLDVSQLSVLQPIMTARFQMCAQKGFDAVEPDNMDGYENSTGFAITAAQQLAYNTWIADEVHALGMAVFEKNDPDQASQLEPYFDGVIDEQCNEYSQCSSYQAYLNAGKPVLNAEYQSSLYPGFCSSDNAAGMMGALYAISLDGSVYQPCFGPSTTSPLPPNLGPPAPSGTGPVPGIGKATPARPTVTISTTALAVRRGRVSIRLGCPSGQSFCEGTIRLTAIARPRRHRGRTTVGLGKAHFHLAGGRRRDVVLRLAAKALARLPRKSASARIAVTDRNQLGLVAHSSRSATLKLAPRRSRPLGAGPHKRRTG